MEDIGVFFEFATKNDGTGPQSNAITPTYDSEAESACWPTIPHGDLEDTKMDHFRLEELPADLLPIVFEMLLSMSKQSALALAAASHYYYRTGFPILHRDVDIDSLGLGSQRFLSRPRNSRVPTFVRNVRVSSDYSESKRDEQRKLVELISFMRNLKTFTWMGSYEIPSSILRAIESLPSQPRLILDPTKLNPRGSAWEDEDFWGSRPAGLHGLISPRLDTLVLYDKYILPEDREDYQHCISRILRCCPSIRVVKGSRTLDRAEKTAIPISPGPEGRFPPVQEISYMPIVIEDTVIGEWAMLKTLKVESIHELAPFEGSVPSLKSLTIHSTCLTDLTGRQGWGLELGPLQKIELLGQISSEVPFEFLSCYGETLEELVIHSAESKGIPRDGIRPSRLRFLAKRCTRIRTLDVNLNPGWVWQGRWPVNFLRAISSFPSLEDLTLIASCQQAAYKPKRLVISRQSVNELYELLRLTKLGCHLRSLRVEHTEFLWNRVCEEWEVELEAIYLCILGSDMQTQVTRLNPTIDFPDAELKWKLASGEYSHPYEKDVKAFPLKRYTKDADLIWLAQNLGLLHSLAQDGLLNGSDILVPANHAPAYDARVLFEQHLNGEVDGRATLRRELQVRKWVKDHGSKVFLYDVLYPPC